MSKKIILGLLSAVCIVIIVGLATINQNKENALVPVSERNQKASDLVEIHSSDGQELTVYEMSADEYEKTDFSVPTKVLDDETAKKNYEETGSVADIANNLSCVSVEVLDKIFIDYIAKTNDIGMVVVAKDYLSQEAIDKITKEYVETTDDVGILEALHKNISN